MVKVFDWILVVALIGGMIISVIAYFHIPLAIGLLTGIVLLIGLQILDTLWKQEKVK